MATKSIGYKLALENREFVRGIQDARSEFDRLDSTTRSNNLGQYSGDMQLATGATTSFSRSSVAAGGNLRSLLAGFRSGGSIAGFTAATGGAAAALAGFAITTKLAKANLEGYAEYDSLVRGLTAIEGSAGAATNRIATLREVAKTPGLGLEEAVRADIRLRAVGLSAETSETSLKAFGNALATVGGGKAELDGVILALTQIAAKGKVSAEEINQIAERVPQVRQAMKDAFGTADTEQLGRAGVEATEFIEGLVAELGNLPAATSGAQNALDNYDDAWKAVKNEASGFAAELSGKWLNSVTGTLNQARRDLSFLRAGFDATYSIGIDDSKLRGIVAEIKAKREAESIDEQADEAANRRNLERQIREAQINADQIAWAKKKAEDEERNDRERIARIEELGAKYREMNRTPEEQIRAKISAIQEEGPSTKEDFANTRDLGVKEEIMERIVEIMGLEKQLSTLQETKAAIAKREAEAAERKANAAAREKANQEQAVANFQRQNQILEARAAGDSRRAAQLEKQARIEELTARIQREQGLAKEEAQEAAERRVALEEAASGPRAGRGRRIGFLSEDERDARRAARQARRLDVRAGLIEDAKIAANNPPPAKPAEPKDSGKEISRKLDKLAAIEKAVTSVGKA